MPAREQYLIALHPEEDTEMHHGDELTELMKKAAEQRGFGATGKFPEEKLTPTDEGELCFGVSSDGGKVVLNFGNKPIAWIALSPAQALQLAKSLEWHANHST